MLLIKKEVLQNDYEMCLLTCSTTYPKFRRERWNQRINIKYVFFIHILKHSFLHCFFLSCANSLVVKNTKPKEIFLDNAMQQALLSPAASGVFHSLFRLLLTPLRKLIQNPTAITFRKCLQISLWNELGFFNMYQYCC